MFDLAEMDTYTGSNEGRDMELKTPKGFPAKDENGNAIKFTFLGRMSDVGRDIDTAQSKARLQRMQETGRSDIDPEEQERLTVDLLVKLCRGWTFKNLDGGDFPFSEENARKLFSDRRFINIRRQCLTFVNDEANFTKA